MLSEFKKFIMRGNVLDLAIGVIIGASFGKIVTSFTENILMPPLGLLLGKVDFSSLFINLTPDKLTKADKTVVSLADAKEAGAAVIAYGTFLNTVLDFLIIAFVIFLIVRAVNRLTPKEVEAEAPVTAKECPYCISSIPLAATRCAHCTSQLDGAPA